LKKLQFTRKISQHLQIIDKLHWPDFLDRVRNSRVKLPRITAKKLSIFIIGDATLSSLELNLIRAIDKDGYESGARTFHGDFDQFLSSQMASCRQLLVDRTVSLIKNKFEDEQLENDNEIIVGINLGVCRRQEKQDPQQTVENIMDVYSQFTSKGLRCFLISACPILVSESRLTPYSETWSSLVNHELSQACLKNSIPYLPLHHCLYSHLNGRICVAPSRKLVQAKGVLGSDGKWRISSEIVQFIKDCQHG